MVDETVGGMAAGEAEVRGRRCHTIISPAVGSATARPSRDGGQTKKPAQCTFEQVEQMIDCTLLSELEVNGTARVGASAVEAAVATIVIRPAILALTQIWCSSNLFCAD